MAEPPDVDGFLNNVIRWLIYLLPRDEIGALISIDIVHHEVHEGDHYEAAVFDADVDIVAPKYIRVTAPDSAVRCHMVYEASSNGEFLIEIYEDPTLNAPGAAVATFNNDRNSANTATATVFQDTTTQAPNFDGTLLPGGGYSGGGKKASSESLGSRLEGILKQAEDYIFKITVLANGTSVNLKLGWYEHL